MTRKEMILSMFCTQYDILKTDMEEIQKNLRYRQISTIDCIELIIAKEKFEYLRDMSKWIFQIMKIDENGEFEKLFEKFDNEQKNKVKFWKVEFIW